MIKSAIFGTYWNSMPQIKKILSCFIVISISFSALGQYTETINSNRPGASQGAFAVGTQVIQVEAGFDLGNDNHRLLLTDIDITGVNLGLRYGLLFEQLEINADVRYQFNQISFTSGNAPGVTFIGLENMQLGAKYLVYDPYKYAKEEVNLYSYHANVKFKWRTLIPAVSVYGSAAFDFTSNPFTSIREDGISPSGAIITQNNWDRWVWVNNFIFDRITTDFPSYAWITTMTYSFVPRISGFIEFQFINGDLYTDQIGRLGSTFLITKDLQVDLSGLFNVKDTPQRWNVGFGLSYRLDLHDYDEELEIEKDDSKGSAQRQSDRINKRKKRKKNKRKDAIVPDGGNGGGN